MITEPIKGFLPLFRSWFDTAAMAEKVGVSGSPDNLLAELDLGPMVEAEPRLLNHTPVSAAEAAVCWRWCVRTWSMRAVPTVWTCAPLRPSSAGWPTIPRARPTISRSSGCCVKPRSDLGRQGAAAAQPRNPLATVSRASRWAGS